MELIAIGLILLVVFLIVRWGNKRFGRGIGMLIGFALFGWTAFGLIALIAMVFGAVVAVFLPALVPLIISIGMGFWLSRVLRRWSKK